MPTDDRFTPPSRPEIWELKHKDGRVTYRTAQTAFFAAQLAGWKLSELAETPRLVTALPEGFKR